MKSKKQIVCISTHYWKDPWFRKQHFMSRFHKKGYQIAYIEPSFSMVRQPDPARKNFATNCFFKVSVKEIEEGLWIIQPPRYLPFYTRPWMSRLNSWLMSLSISRELKRLGFKDYLLWIYLSEYALALSLFSYKKLVFDLVDDLAAFGRKNKKKCDFIKQSVEFLAVQSDLMIVSASALFEEFGKYSSNVILVPNGFDDRLFSNIHLPIPEELSGIPEPYFGFIGTIFSFLDFDLLEYIFKNNPEKSFVFVGLCEADVKKRWHFILNNFPNVFWLGPKPKESIPAFINQFSVCLNPFKVDEVSKGANPLKVFEYLALKKPVISVTMESLEKEKISPLIYFARNYQEFNQLLGKALVEDQTGRDYSLVKEYSWDRLFEKVSTSVERLL